MKRLALTLLLLAAPAWAGGVTVLDRDGNPALGAQWDATTPGLWLTYYGDYHGWMSVEGKYHSGGVISIYRMVTPDGPHFVVGWYFTARPSGPCHLAWAVDLCGRQYFQACDPWDDTDVKVLKIGGRK